MSFLVPDGEYPLELLAGGDLFGIKYGQASGSSDGALLELYRLDDALNRYVIKSGGGKGGDVYYEGEALVTPHGATSAGILQEALQLVLALASNQYVLVFQGGAFRLQALSGVVRATRSRNPALLSKLVDGEAQQRLALPLPAPLRTHTPRPAAKRPPALVSTPVVPTPSGHPLEGVEINDSDFEALDFQFDDETMVVAKQHTPSEDDIEDIENELEQALTHEEPVAAPQIRISQPPAPSRAPASQPVAAPRPISLRGLTGTRRADEEGLSSSEEE